MPKKKCIKLHKKYTKSAKDNNKKVEEQLKWDYPKTTPSLTKNLTNQQIQLEALCHHPYTTQLYLHKEI